VSKLGRYIPRKNEISFIFWGGGGQNDGVKTEEMEDGVDNDKQY